MVIVLTSVGLPTDDITLIIAVDWALYVLCMLISASVLSKYELLYVFQVKGHLAHVLLHFILQRQVPDHGECNGRCFGHRYNGTHLQERLHARGRRGESDLFPQPVILYDGLKWSMHFRTNIFIMPCHKC